MKDEQPISGETALKEYPNSTRWLEGQQIIGVGNLILTNERLVFLHRVAPTNEQITYLRKLSAGATTNRMLDFALALHKKNFQIPLSSFISVKVGLYSLLPFPRPCLRIFYRSQKKKRVKSTSFMFTIPLLKGFFQLEITTVLGWTWMIKRALKNKLLPQYGEKLTQEQKA